MRHMVSEDGSKMPGQYVVSPNMLPVVVLGLQVVEAGLKVTSGLNAQCVKQRKLRRCLFY